MKPVFALIILFLPISSINAQVLNSNQHNTLSAGGSHFQAGDSGMMLDWVIGELMVATIIDESENIQLTQGFLQNSITVTSLSEFGSLPFEVSVYPNPTTQNVFIDSKENKNLILDLVSITGTKIITNKKFVQSSNLSLKELSDGIYVIRILDPESNLTGHYKVQKLGN